MICMLGNGIKRGKCGFFLLQFVCRKRIEFPIRCFHIDIEQHMVLPCVLLDAHNETNYTGKLFLANENLNKKKS